MSHNAYTINNEGANVVSYHGANDGVIYIGHGETQAYLGSLTTNDAALEFYDSNPINTIDGATLNKRAGTNWIQSFTLPAGKYEVRSSVLMPTGHPTSTSGVSYCRILVGSTVYRNGIQNATPSFFDENYQYSRPVHCVLDFSAASPTFTMFFGVNRSVISGADSVISNDNRISETAYLFIRKIA